MTQEERQLLLTDICARLVYEVILVAPNLTTIHPTDCNTGLELLIDEGWRPYLRPMSSMTEEENRIFNNHREQIVHSSGKLLTESINAYIDWLNAHHFDYRGLIPMGLALPAPEDMYKNE